MNELPPAKARRTFVERIAAPGGFVDRARTWATDIGARDRRVFLVWTSFAGESRGKGAETVLERHEITPRPRIDFGAITRNPLLVGVVAQGSLRVDEITLHYTFDELTGLLLPNGRPVPVERARVSFFYEVVEDGRGDNPPARPRFRLFNQPDRQAENAQWSLILEPTSDQMTRQGQPERPGLR